MVEDIRKKFSLRANISCVMQETKIFHQGPPSTGRFKKEILFRCEYFLYYARYENLDEGPAMAKSTTRYLSSPKVGTKSAKSTKSKKKLPLTWIMAKSTTRYLLSPKVSTKSAKSTKSRKKTYLSTG